MGATLRVPFARVTPWPDRLFDFRLHGFTLVALTPRAPAIPIDAFAATRPAGKLALIVGTEGAGLSADVEALADVRVRIPMRSDVDSLNLAVASGIALERLT
jgi:tRNA G18 (ribose-2'-O)-methylase SpoU